MSEWTEDARFCRAGGVGAARFSFLIDPPFIHGSVRGILACRASSSACRGVVSNAFESRTGEDDECPAHIAELFLGKSAWKCCEGTRELSGECSWELEEEW
jgi:hypothetical protein